MCEIAEPDRKIADLCSVQILVSLTRPDGHPAPPGENQKLKVCVMFLMKSFDRIAPLFILALGALAAVSTAGLGV